MGGGLNHLSLLLEFTQINQNNRNTVKPVLSYCTFHISCPDSMSKREGISIVLVYQCKL